MYILRGRMELGQTRRDREEREGRPADREREVALAVVTYFFDDDEMLSLCH